MTSDQPTLPLAEPTAAPASARHRPRRWPWLVGLLVVVVLMFVAWFAGEQIARSV
ncbi:MAG: DUF2993 domain-containing protein, partial [Microbacterium sp.]